MRYLFDANVFITAKNTYYAMDIVESFWIRLERSVDGNKVFVVDKVYEEIIKGNDELAAWIKERFCKNTISSNNDILIKKYNQIIDSVTKSGRYTQQAKDEFASAADSWLIAHAYETDYFIVTNEKYDTNIKQRVKIPNICESLRIKYIDLFQFMRYEKINI